MSSEINREQVVVRTSIIGILANVLLVILKGIIGAVSGSIAIILDAINNLTDVLSSVVTIIGTKLAGRAPDRNHPIGHGRLEYLTTMLVAVIILYAGVTALVESVKKILHPVAVSYSGVSIVVMILAIVVKLALGTYVRKKGQSVDSGALEASGLDALFDAVITTSVLLSAVITMFIGVSLEAWVGVFIAVIIIRSGLGMVLEAVDAMMGRRIDGALSKAIKATVCEEPGVIGAYDLFMDNYGPDLYIGALNVEVDENTTAAQIDIMTHHIQDRVFQRHGVRLNNIGVYAYNATNTTAVEMRETCRKLAVAHKGVLQIHGFYVNLEEKKIHFDVVISFTVDDRESLRQHIVHDVKERYPTWSVDTNLDIDLSD